MAEGGRGVRVLKAEKVRDAVGDTVVVVVDTVRTKQMEDPGLEVLPLGQGMHVVLDGAPYAELFVPAGQGVGVFDPKGQ